MNQVKERSKFSLRAISAESSKIHETSKPSQMIDVLRHQIESRFLRTGLF